MQSNAVELTLGLIVVATTPPVIAEIRAKMKKPAQGQPHLKYDYNSIDIENLKQMRATAKDLIGEVIDESAEVMWETWKKSCCKMRDEYIPVMKKSKKAWMTNEILENTNMTKWNIKNWTRRSKRSVR